MTKTEGVTGFILRRVKRFKEARDPESASILPVGDATYYMRAQPNWSTNINRAVMYPARGDFTPILVLGFDYSVIEVSRSIETLTVTEIEAE